MKNLLIIFLLVIGVLLAGVFIVDEREVVVSSSFGSTKVYSTGIYWHLPLSGKLTHVAINQRDSVMSVNFSVITQSESLNMAQVLANWQVIDPIKYVEYLNQHSRKELDQSLADYISAQFLPLSVKINSPQQLISTLDFPESGLSDANLGIRINDIKLLGFKASSQQLVNSESSFTMAESAYNLAIKIKTDADKAQAAKLIQLQKKNQRFYDYFSKINYYQANAESKAAVPAFDQLYK